MIKAIARTLFKQWLAWRKQDNQKRITKRLIAHADARRIDNEFRLEFVELPSGCSSHDVFGSHTLLDAESIDRLATAQCDRLGAIPTEKTNWFWANLSRRLAGRLARRLSAAANIPPLVLTNAIEYTIWVELCLISPLRHLARSLRKQLGRRLILICIDEELFTFRMSFEQRQMAPIYLYAELYRLGCPVFLLKRPNGADPRLCFRLEHLWGSYTPPLTESTVSSSVAMVVSGIRKPSVCLPVDTAFHSIAGPYATIPFTHDLARGLDPLPDIVFDCDSKTSIGRGFFTHRDQAVACLSSPALTPNLFLHIEDKCAAMFRAAMTSVFDFVRRNDIREAHVCDHLFWHSTLVAHAVDRSGGSVTLWPHSSNPGHPSAPRGYRVDRIYCATQVGAGIWARQFNDTDIVVKGELALAPMSKDGPVAFSRLSVVLVGGADRLNFMPLYNPRKHAESLQAFAKALRDREPDIKLYFKTKPSFQAETYFHDVLGSIDVECISENPLRMDLPGPIFVSVSFGSTLLLEAIAGNAVSMIVRDFAIEDYTTIRDGAVPIGPRSRIVELIRQCHDETFYNAMLEQQRNWLRLETNMS